MAVDQELIDRIALQAVDQGTFRLEVQVSKADDWLDISCINAIPQIFRDEDINVFEENQVEESVSQTPAATK